jgi:hypothetical protein
MMLSRTACELKYHQNVCIAVVTAIALASRRSG